MAISKNQIYTNIVNAVTDAFPTAYCAGRIEPIPDHFPAVYARMIGFSIPVNSVSLTFDSHLERPTYEVQVFSAKENDAGQEAYDIMRVVGSVMASMGFLCDMVEPIDNIDPTVFRIVGRWHRIIGDGDTVEDYVPTP